MSDRAAFMALSKGISPLGLTPLLRWLLSILMTNHDDWEVTEINIDEKKIMNDMSILTNMMILPSFRHKKFIKKKYNYNLG